MIGVNKFEDIFPPQSINKVEGTIDYLKTKDYTYQEFPRMLYHSVEGEKVVNDQKEMVECLNRGWKKDRSFTISEEVEIADKIAWHRAEIIELEDRLSQLNMGTRKEEKEETKNLLPPKITLSVEEKRIEAAAAAPIIQKRTRIRNIVPEEVNRAVT